MMYNQNFTVIHICLPHQDYSIVSYFTETVCRYNTETGLCCQTIW